MDLNIIILNGCVFFNFCHIALEWLMKYIKVLLKILLLLLLLVGTLIAKYETLGKIFQYFFFKLLDHSGIGKYYIPPCIDREMEGHGDKTAHYT